MNEKKDPLENTPPQAGDKIKDPLKNALQAVNKNLEIHKGPQDEKIREANASDLSFGDSEKLNADDFGE